MSIAHKNTINSRITNKNFIVLCVHCSLVAPKEPALHRRAHIPSIHGLEILNCSNCLLLTNIPSIQGLRELDCSNCQCLTCGSKEPALHRRAHIPSIQGLEKLDCSYCELLTYIPSIQGLKKLFCYNCALLTNIPSIQGLRELDCSGCKLLTNIPLTSIQGLQDLHFYNCLWLNIKNKEFETNIKMLKILQQWIKKIILSKRLSELIPLLIPLYYDPEAKGGYFHKKNMLKFIINIKK